MVEKRVVSFVRALVKSGPARIDASERFRLSDGKRGIYLTRDDAQALASLGVVSTEVDGSLLARAEARTWVVRQMAGPEGFDLQHKTGGRGGTPNLSAHQKAAADRVSRLFQRAHLRARVTMDYSPDRTVSRDAGGRGSLDLTDSAIAARYALNAALDCLHRDCAGVVLDVCGFEKGLQTIEIERQWPRRSAKLVLRIGLDQLARHFGLDAEATGRGRGQVAGWMGEGARPTSFE